MLELPVPAADGEVHPGGSGLSTFLLTDIEGSTRLWEEHPEAMGPALANHDRLLREAIGRSGGSIVKTTGDGLLAVFDDPVAAVGAALFAQRSLRDVAWGETGPLRVRMAIHSGAAEAREGDFFGPALNRDARILAIGHGGQILLSAVAAVLTRDRLPTDVEVLDRGSHRLRDLDRPEQVFQVAVGDLPSDFPPLRSLSTRRSNLPVQLTSFVGRERELGEVERLIGRARLVTLIGTGGTGKTRLMIEVAGRIAGRFADGAWIAELAPLGDPVQIAPELATALGVPELPGRPAIELVMEFLASKELLLILDNAEHLIDGVADVAGRLLAGAPGIRILTTSREALAVAGEAVFQVPSLTCPSYHDAFSAGATAPVSLPEASASEAVRLFSERAGAVLPSFELTSANVGAVSEICRRLDGIPLAIELAAGRVSAMSPQEIALGLGDRFRLLTGGRRTAVPRQQTLHALIDWSWDLLTEDDQRLLRRLSIFAGGWTASAVASVTGEIAAGTDPGLIETLDGLARLVDRSLVIVDRGPTTRYRMLETIRQYARERLIEAGEATPIADRHLAFYSGLAEAAVRELHGPAMVDWLDRLDADAENLGIALEWGLESAPEQAIRMCVAMLAYWRMRTASPDNQERVIAAVGAARRMLGGLPDPSPDQRILAARMLGDAATIWSFSDRADVAIGWAEQAVQVARASGDRSAIISAEVGFALARIFTGARGDLLGGLAELVQLATEAEDWWTIATIAGGAAGGLSSLDPTAAEALLTVANVAARRSGNPYAIAVTSMGAGRLYATSGRFDEARVSLEEAIARFAEIGDGRFALACRSELAHAVRGAGLLDEAMGRYRETITAWVRLGNRGAVARELECIAFIAVEQGELVRGATLLGTAEALRETAASPMIVTEMDEHARWVERLRAGNQPTVINGAWAEGRAMSVPDAVAFAVGEAT